jgi:hypothetical protein
MSIIIMDSASYNSAIIDKIRNEVQSLLGYTAV